MPIVLPAKSRTAIGFLSFDGVSDDEHSQTTTVTSETIEDGSRLTDHAVTEPRPLSMTVIATRSTGSVTPTPDTSFDPARHEQLYQALLELQRSVTLVLIVTSIDVYPSMLITEVRRPRASQADTNRARITVKAMEIQITTLAQLANLADALLDLAQAEANLGAASLVDTGEFAVP